MKSVLVTVVIPIKNPGEEIFEIIEVLQRQKLQNFEVLIIDSGSESSKLQKIKKRLTKKFTLVEIPASEFGHSKTRNLAVTLARGEYIAFLTHDAVPTSQDWLNELIGVLKEDKTLGASFGPHEAHPHHGQFISEDLRRHFRNFENRGPVFIEDKLRWETDLSYRQNLHFLSNNNAAYRRVVLQKIPFPAVEFSEDQAWALNALEAGVGITYSPRASVFHSHKFSPFQMFKRAMDEGKSLHAVFGYKIEQSILSVFNSSLTIVKNDVGLWLKNRKTISLRDLVYRSVGIFFARVGYFVGGKNSGEHSKKNNRFSLDAELRNGTRSGDFRKLRS